MAAQKRGLGRGLDALLGNLSETPTSDTEDNRKGAVSDIEPLLQLPVDLIQRGKYQPRREMEPEALQELADSIKVQGVMQPIVVRPVSTERYEIIAGERRWRATQLAGLGEIPAIVRDVSDEAAIAMALIENIQRENLNPIEEAVALQRLQQEFDLTQQQVAEAVGKSRATVANLMRLIGLNEEVKELLAKGRLDMGHARALLALAANDQSGAAREVATKQLSVRQTEALVKKLLVQEQQGAKKKVSVDPDIRHLERRLSEQLGSQVAIQHGSMGKGKLIIKYNSSDELEGILRHIK